MSNKIMLLIRSKLAPKIKREIYFSLPPLDDFIGFYDVIP
jgi:hypothetical protein